MLKVGKFVVLVVAILVSFNSLSWAIMPGDVNGNGKQDLVDAMIILQTVAGLRPAIEGGTAYYPAVVGYSWTYDEIPSSGTPISTVTTVVSANSAGFSVRSQRASESTYQESNYVYDGTSLKLASSPTYSADGTLLSKNEWAPAALVIPSVMVKNNVESTASEQKYTTSTSTTVSTSLLSSRIITVNGEEEVTTPADTFTAMKITHTNIRTTLTGTPTVQTTTSTYWYVKNIGRVKVLTSVTSGSTTTTTTTVLTSYSQTAAVSPSDDIQAIIAVWMKFATFFSTGLPSPTDPQFTALFASDYLSSGRDLNSQLIGFSTDAEMIGLTITGVAIKNVDLTTGTAWVSLSGTQNGQPFSENNNGPAPFKMVKINGVWQIQGNRQMIDVSGNALALYYPLQTDPASSMQTGLSTYIKANTPAGALVNSVVVTGPGLPYAGITLTRQSTYDWFALPGGGDFYNTMNDATIAAIPDNAVYTFTVKNSAGAVLDTYAKILPKRPLMRTELSSALFPNVTTPTAEELRTFNGGSLAVSWTLPASLVSNWMSLALAETNWINSVRSESRLGSADLSKTLTTQPVTSTGVTFTPTYRQLQVQGRDAYGRRFESILY